MLDMKPASAELMAFHRAHFSRYVADSDGMLIPRFSDFCRNELSKFLPELAVVDLIEAVVRFGDYTNEPDHKSMQRAVIKLLKADGISLPRGKRPRFDMLALVKNITPILLYYGVPRASSPRSHLVLILTIISEEIQIKGDPRDELRRVIKLEKKLIMATRLAVAKIFANALNPNGPDYPE